MKIEINGEHIIALNTYQDWCDKIPEALGKRSNYDTHLFVDKEGNYLYIGEDFALAEKHDLFPVNVYKLQRTADYINSKVLNQMEG